MGNCNINDAKKIASLDPREAIEIVGGNNIEVVEEQLIDKTRYTINYKPYSAPVINTTSSAGITKVGVTVSTVTFNGTIVKGSDDIIYRNMTPNKGLDLTVPFSWQETNVLGTTPGLWPRFSGTPTTITVSDGTTNVTKQVGVEYRHLFYMGYSTKEVLTEEDIKSLVTQDLLTSILSKYSTFTYNYSLNTVYIYWVFPSDTAGFTLAEEGPLPVPLKLDMPTVTIVDSGISKPYKVIRTAVKTKLVNAIIKLS